VLHRPGLKDSIMPEPLEPGVYGAAEHAALASPSLFLNGYASISYITDDSANLDRWSRSVARQAGEKACTIRGFRMSPAPCGSPFLLG